MRGSSISTKVRATNQAETIAGIFLLSIAGKILAKVILNRLNKHLLDEVVPESQCGFRKNRGTVDMIFASKQIQEKCKEQNRDLYILFVDLTKAFDTVSRPGLLEYPTTNWNTPKNGQDDSIVPRWNES